MAFRAVSETIETNSSGMLEVSLQEKKTRMKKLLVFKAALKTEVKIKVSNLLKQTRQKCCKVSLQLEKKGGKCFGSSRLH